MTKQDIATQRLHNQRVENTTLKAPSDVVAWLGAVQAQDYAGAKWAIGLRSQNVTNADIEQVFTDGKILRTHVLRPTWHFVTPEDIRWLLKLTAPRVHAVNAYQYRQLELDDTLFKRSHDVLIKTLQGGKQRTRSELATALERADIKAEGMRLGYIMMQAELEGIICSGARRGKQFTYALLEERAPYAKSLEKDEALAEIVKRYFSSHGPATLQDFVWWSGLTVVDVKIGLELNHAYLVQEVIGDHAYWFSITSEVKPSSRVAHLLPPYDEYTIAYKNHSPVLGLAYLEQAKNSLFGGVMIISGQVIGYWRRTLKKDTVALEFNPFRSLGKTEKKAFASVVERYGMFLGKAALLEE
jgi:Winged helix DNA-binding domain